MCTEFFRILKAAKIERMLHNQTTHQELIGEAITYGISHALFTRQTLQRVSVADRYTSAFQHEFGAGIRIFFGKRGKSDMHLGAAFIEGQSLMAEKQKTPQVEAFVIDDMTKLVN